MIISLAKLSGRSLLLLTLILPPSVAAAQTMDAGQKAFQVCGACHDVGEAARSKVGPPLNGLFGRGAASVEGFPYTDALRNSGIVWDDNTFQQFVKDPHALVPGTKMAFAGIKDDSVIGGSPRHHRQNACTTLHEHARSAAQLSSAAAQAMAVAWHAASERAGSLRNRECRLHVPLELNSGERPWIGD